MHPLVSYTLVTAREREAVARAAAERRDVRRRRRFRGWTRDLAGLPGTLRPA